MGYEERQLLYKLVEDVTFLRKELEDAKAKQNPQPQGVK